ncbi:hypothetical protein [Prescottella sp. R16]|uniref:hypothetical protein n=1 Tax=Prescottella sp. R16 TaxID=3064529 RepID=UPI00272DFB93|nr:hypothetical protein [Prescottella sp. R16]
MPRRQEHADRYTDALAALSAATHRPTNIVEYGDGFAIRVDFAFDRFLVAVNTDTGLSDDPDAVEGWIVRFCETADSGVRVLAESRKGWLVDAFDDVFEAVDKAGQWIESDAQLGELTQQRDTYDS